MKLQRLKVENLRQFVQPLEIRDFEPGLNLFVGPNEAGKSTLVRAIRAAFFERHRSKSVDDLLPWSDPSAGPSIELDFHTGNTDHRLKKVFLQRKRCELIIGPRRLDGEEAEQHLAELLGFSFPGKGSSKPEHWGVPGLLWIEQGNGHQVHEAVGHATDHLRKALGPALGAVASSQGDALIERVRSERNELLTVAGKPRGIYTEAINSQDALTSKLRELDERIAGYRDQVDRLGRLRAEDATERVAPPWLEFRAQQKHGEERLAALNEQKRQLDSDRATLARLDASLGLVRDRLKGFDEQQSALAAREAALIEAASRLAAASAVDAHGSATQATAEAAYREATEALAAARQAELRMTLARSLADGAARITALTELIARAQAARDELDALRKLTLDTRLTKADLDTLRAQHTSLRELEIRQQTAATRLSFELLPGADVQLDDAPVSANHETWLTRAATITIAGIGRLHVVPGGTDLAELARQSSELQATHRALLQRLALASLPAAEERFAQHQQASLDLRHAEKSLAALAPKGLDALAAELAEQRARHADAESRWATLPPAPSTPAEPVDQAATRQDAARARLDQITREARQARDALTTARSRHDSALRERDALLAMLADPQRQHRQQEAQQQRLAFENERQSLAASTTDRQRLIDEARPDILAQDIERYRRSAEQAERLFSERQTQLSVLQGKLEEAGAQGLEEERAELAVQADAAARRVGELSLRAKSLDLLLGLLDAKRQALTRRLQAPLHQHLQRYLPLLFPQATLDIADDLTPTLLTRQGPRGAEAGPFQRLSFGAQEQMALISRLAYADLLKASGRPTLLILDDALVHSDEERLKAMKRVLYDAAQRHQVLLFSCHPAAWRDLGATPRAIGAFRTAP